MDNKPIEEIQNRAENVLKDAETINVVLSEMRINLDTALQMASDEKLRIIKSYEEQMKDMRKHFKHIILALIITLAILLGGIIAGIIYVFTTYEFLPYTTTYSQSAENGCDFTIYDGIKVNMG